jgi:hypothetical protein
MSKGKADLTNVYMYPSSGQGTQQSLESDNLQGGGEPPTFGSMERTVRLEALVDRIEKDLTELRADGKSTRQTMAGIGLALAALIVALWAAGLSQQANMLAAFQSGLTAVQNNQANAPQNPAPQPIIIQIPNAPPAARDQPTAP